MKSVRMRWDTASTRFGLLATHAYHTRYISKYITGSVPIKFVYILTSGDWICLNGLEMSNKYRMDDAEKTAALFFFNYDTGCLRGTVQNNPRSLKLWVKYLF